MKKIYLHFSHNINIDFCFLELIYKQIFKNKLILYIKIPLTCFSGLSTLEIIFPYV